MKLRTEIFPAAFPKSLSIRHPVLSIGSCFAVHIAERLAKLKHLVVSNPFGVVFNPISIDKALRKIQGNEFYGEGDLVKFNDLWISLDHHGAFNHPDKTICLDQINTHLLAAHNHLQKTEHLFITFGSAWVYEHLKSKSVVANCHKIPQKEFRKYCLSSGEIAQYFSERFDSLLANNPGLQIVLSVSPVRHWKDGAEENAYSKSVLRIACEVLRQKFKAVIYFPAYEIMMDDLRDYRFYKSDLIHPTSLAVDYIWDKFKIAAFDNETSLLHSRIESITNRFLHRPIHESRPEYDKFLHQLLADIRDIEEEFGFLNFKPEKEILLTKISS